MLKHFLFAACFSVSAASAQLLEGLTGYYSFESQADGVSPNAVVTTPSQPPTSNPAEGIASAWQRLQLYRTTAKKTGRKALHNYLFLITNLLSKL